MSNLIEHTQYLQRCLAIAMTRQGFCAPNPAVGCVIVKGHQVIAEGCHYACGYDHAEVDALQKIGDQARGAILYVSLEPCAHFGRTPPCVHAIQTAGISAVFFGFKDPDPRVSGQGQAFLMRHGIPCVHVDLPQVNDFYRAYAHWVSKRLPFVTAKLAISRDQKIAGAKKEPMAITGAQCHALTHAHRLASDAMLTTAQTIICDNPQLDVRISDTTIKKPIYILDTNARLPCNAQIFETAASVSVFHGPNCDHAAKRRLESRGVRCIAVALQDNGLCLESVFAQIGQDGCHALWVEAGDILMMRLLAEQRLQRFLLYVADHSLGQACYQTRVSIEMLEDHFNQHVREQLGRDEVHDFY